MINSCYVCVLGFYVFCVYCNCCMCGECFVGGFYIGISSCYECNWYSFILYMV